MCLFVYIEELFLFSKGRRHSFIWSLVLLKGNSFKEFCNLLNMLSYIKFLHTQGRIASLLASYVFYNHLR